MQYQGIYRGSVVKLKSGGPYMIVTYVAEINGRARVYCEWFQNDKTRRAFFPVASLRLADVFAQ
jgi:uncharacterized protein YodC (DUF2158 family)